MTQPNQESKTPQKLISEEEREILESAPKGTLFIILLFGLIFILAWLVLFFGRFLGRGPVS
jgi:hypothetical protein